jgi:hypothetical protein
MDWSAPASEERIQRTAASLGANGFHARVVDDPAQAKAAAVETIPAGAEVFTSTSVTVDESGLTHEINESGRFVSLRKRLMELSKEERATKGRELIAHPRWVTGSVHAITQAGQILVASQSGSNVATYAFTASHVLWLVGSQKLVATLDDGLRRLREHALPLEHERAKKAYGTGSSINKVLLLEKEPVKDRAHVILIRQAVGF